MNSHSPIPASGEFEGFGPGRLWSLWEMMNFKIAGLRTIQGELGLIINMANKNADAVAHVPYGQKNPAIRDDPEHQSNIDDTKKWVDRMAQMAENGLGYLKCPHIDQATKALTWWNKQENPLWSDLRAKTIALRDAIDTELKQYSYYQYPKEKGQLFKRWKEDWAPAINAFPSIETDACHATDCYALDENVAAVFHSMRILEFGLREIATDVGLTFDVQQWHNIIEQIESRITAERKNLPKGAERNERLQFLSEAAKEFFYFKDGWRNYVSHNRANYDEHQALGVLVHVRSFMNHLASQLSEEV